MKATPTLQSIQKKIAAIVAHKVNSEGLTTEEIDIAVDSGLIDPEQTWYWTEEWQQNERRAENDIKTGNLSHKFVDIETAMIAIKTENS